MTCTKCSLAKSCMSVQIPPKGPDNVDILIVCDSPGNEEDFRGEGFVGPIADLLREMVSDAGLNAYKVGYTYALRCKVPYGDAPWTHYIDACRSYLKEEIHGRNPRVVIACGDTSLRSLARLSGVKDKRGKELKLVSEIARRLLPEDSTGYRGRAEDTPPTLFCTYSPEFVKRAPQTRRTVTTDLRRALTFLNKDTSKDATINWKWWEGEEILGDVLSYDIEAVDEKGNYTDYPTQMAITGSNGTFVTLNQVRELAQTLVGRRTVGHNTWGYDVRMLRAYGVPVENDWDTMILAYYMDETQPQGLESLAVKYLGVPGWKEAFDAALGSDEFAQYNARDAYYTLQLFHHFQQELGERIDVVEKLLLPVRNCLDRMSARGIYIDKKAVEEQRAVSEFVISWEDVLLSEAVGDETFNPNSSAQVASYLTGRGFHLPVTEKGNPQTSVAILQEYQDDPFVSSLLRYRTEKKTLGTYVLPYLKLANTGDGRAHPEFSLAKTKTGRTSSRNPNSQNLTRELQHFFGVPPGKVILSVDYSSMQFRIAAWFAKEKTILENYALNAEWDAHRFFGAMFYATVEELVTKDQRQTAKSANFSQLFVGNEKTIYDYAKREMQLEIPMETCWAIHQAWHKAFPGYFAFYKLIKDEIKRTGKVACPTGHIRHFGDPRLFDRKTLGEAIREGVNVLVQNLEAHIIFLAMRELDKLGFPMVNMVHDSLKFEFSKDAYDPAIAQQISDIMCVRTVELLKTENNIHFDVPLLVESAVYGA